MSTLHLDFSCDPKPNALLPIMVLQRHPTKDDLPSEAYCVSHVEELHRNTHTAVYRAVMNKVTPASTAHSNVVLKTDIYAAELRPKAFNNELCMYERMEKLQDWIIPRCYGLFRTKWKGSEVSFLVLDDCGYCIESMIDDLSLEFKEKVINKLYKLHRSGFSHGDMCLRNVLSKGGEPFFIDLEFAKSHKCRVRQRVIIDDLPPPICDFGCKEIYKLSLSLSVWASRFVHWSGHSFSRHSVSWELLDNMLYKIRFYITSDEHREHVRESLKVLVAEVEELREACKHITYEDRYILPLPPDLTPDDEYDPNYVYYQYQPSVPMHGQTDNDATHP